MFDLNLPVAAIPENYREFLPTMTTPAVDDMIREYEDGEREMRKLHSHLMSEGNRTTLKNFAQGAEVYYQSSSKGRIWTMDLIEMFNLQRAINARAETYWFGLFQLCGLSTILPSDMWHTWYQSFTAWRKEVGVGIPLFDRSTVYGSLSLIEAHRANFFSMRVDALWKALSNTHKTNYGSAFHKRFILDSMYSERGSPSSKNRGFLDLVNMCSTIITGTDNPFFKGDDVLTEARKNHCGEWFEIFDGVLRIRAYQVGTLHCEIHPEVANRLNVALAYLHPMGLADDSLTKRPRHKEGFGSDMLIRSTIPRQVRGYLAECRQTQREDGLWELQQCWDATDKAQINEVIKTMIDEVLAQVGGVRERFTHLFDYPPADVVSHIVKSGEVPEKVSHQFYATSASLAIELVEWVGVKESDICYESSAGMGGIAKHMPLQTYCVEVDRLRAMALDKMGFEVKQGDFLQMEPDDLMGQADTLLMNPPFRGGQWQAHIKHAVAFVRPGGVIGAILPEGAPRKMPTLEGYEVEYSKPKANQFPDASISVVFAKWKKPLATAPQSASEPRDSLLVGDAQDYFKRAS